ncbi:MAG TPA: hypothetical protein VEB42_04815 [Chitinophagaceae bacterium]|nr:hypothetical protein [Chitinophagaceae bacterium]
MKRYLIIILITSFAAADAAAQGCVAIRSTGAVCTRQDAEHTTNSKGWQLNTSYRYFKSFRHFVGTEEQKERMEQNTEVINWSHSMTFSVVRNLNSRWSLSLDVPVLAYTRSSLYEHAGNNAGASGRHKTRSFGLGDIRVAAYHWLLDPMKSMKGNVQVGLGLKLATGDYQYQDFFVKADGSKVLGPVDQSIQLGDGGTGFTAEVNAYYNFNKTIGVYGNGYYLINPREQNGVSTGRGAAPSASAITYGTSTMSVPDQFMARLGANVNVQHLGFSLGGRLEGIPAKDLVGGSSGFRRPGYVVSVEPGMSYTFKKTTAFVTVPVAVKRDRIQSMADKLRTDATGVYTQGDAAFADYLISVGFSIKL